MLRSNSAVAVIEPHLGRAATSILSVLALAVLLLHIMACLFHWLAVVQLAPAAAAGGGPGGSDAAAVFWLGRLTWLESAGLEAAPVVARWVPPLPLASDGTSGILSTHPAQLG